MADPEKRSDQSQLRQRLGWVSWSRIGIHSLLAITTFATFRETPFAPTPFVLLITTAFTTAVSFLSLPRWSSKLLVRAFGYFQIALDICFASVVVYLTGGAESAFSVLFHLSVIVAAFLHGNRGAVVSAISGAAVFTSISLLLHGGILSGPTDLLVVPALMSREVAYYISVNIAGLFLVAALAGYLSERELRTGGKLAEARRVTEDLAALNEDIVRSLTIGLAATDAQGTIMWMNPAGASIINDLPKNLVGKPLSTLFDIEPENEDGYSQGETTFIKESSGQVIISYRIAPLLDGRKKPRGSLLVFQDQTELRKMQEKVEHAQRLVALGRIAAGFAHELRNPLGSISGSLEILQEGSDLQSDDRHLVGIMLREINRLADLVTQMLDLAKPRPPEPIKTDLSSIIHEVVHVIRSSAEAEDLDIQTQIDDELFVIVDPDQIRQLLWNLLKNATQASPSETTVTIDAHMKEQNLTIRIQDSGSGIADEDQEKVFEPFFSTKRGGIGMGLAISRQVVEGHGGTIRVEKADHQGSVFIAEIPQKV